MELAEEYIQLETLYKSALSSPGRQDKAIFEASVCFLEHVRDALAGAEMSKDQARVWIDRLQEHINAYTQRFQIKRLQTKDEYKQVFADQSAQGLSKQKLVIVIHEILQLLNRSELDMIKPTSKVSKQPDAAKGLSKQRKMHKNKWLRS